MAFSRSLFSVLLLCVACKASNVPAFLWGDLAEPNLKSNPLMTTTSPAFSIILSKELVDTFTVVFVEKTLSIEDFSHRNDEGLTSFSYLHENYRKAVYLSSVENAVLALDLLEDSKQIKLTENGLSEKYLSTTGSTLIIYLEDAVEGESRYDMLRRHDSFMKETVSNLRKQHSKVVGVYTGLKGTANISHFRLRRQAANSNSSDYKLDGLRLYSKTITLTDGPKTVSLHGLSSSTSVINSTALTLSSTLNFPDNSIVLNFKGVGGYWFFDSVTLNPGGENAIDLFPNEEVFALIGFSYRCGQNVTFGDGNSTRHIFFEDLKVQPVFMNTNDTNPVEFGDSFNCVGFFSAPIWSGLFVVFILLSITFYGIMMMMDIRTMDRFDDPKGKTITINAE